MPILSAWELADMRDTFSEDLGQTCTVLRQSKASGLTKGEYATVGTNVPCAVLPTPSGAQAGVIATMLGTGSIKQPDTRSVAFAYNADVRAGDTLVMGNTHYEVKGVDLDIDNQQDVDQAIGLVASVEIKRTQKGA